MSTTAPMAEPGSHAVAALKALVPSVAGACAAFGLRAAGAGEFAEVTGAAVAILVGLPFLQQATRQDGQRAAARSSSRPSGADGASAVRHAGVVPSPTTVALAVVLAAAAFWLADLLTTWMGTGSLGYLNGEYPDDASVAARKVALRSLPVFVPAVFLISVAIGHRLRARAAGALKTAVLLYTVAVLVFNQLLLRHWETIAPDQVERTPEAVYLPVVFGILSWFVCRLGRSFAARTQTRYDAVEAARLRVRADTHD
jgi:hypothetical protein